MGTGLCVELARIVASTPWNPRILKGGVVIALIFPNVRAHRTYYQIKQLQVQGSLY